MSEHDAEQCVRQFLDEADRYRAKRNAVGFSLRGLIATAVDEDRDASHELTTTDLREVLRLLGEARSELGKLTTERDEARNRARMSHRALIAIAGRYQPLRSAQNAPPDWLTAEPTDVPRHGPHKGQGDDTDAAATPRKTRPENGPQGRAEDQDET